jgi:hypothetical protein
MKFARIAFVAIVSALAVPAVAQTNAPAAQAKPTASDMEILRQKIKADKKLVVAANMQLTEAEAKGFWPVYEAYQKDLAQINSRIAQAVKAYAEAYSKATLSDEMAKKLISEAIAIEESEAKMKRDTMAKLDKVIPGIKIARYIQIETKIRAIIRYELAANIPLAE